MAANPAPTKATRYNAGLRYFYFPIAYTFPGPPKVPAIEPFGFSENGLQAAAYYWPPRKKFDTRCRAAITKISYRDAAPVAPGMSLSILDERPALTMVDDWDVQYRRAYGYIGGIRLLPARLTKMNV